MKFQSILILLLTICFFTACEKELSVENGLLPGGGGSSGGTAVYTFADGTGSCTGAIVSGSYTAGTALTAANTVSLRVNVSTPGSYTLTSATVNGVAFSASGTFAGTGLQTIILTGSGIPLAAGDYNYQPGSSGCTFTITVNESGSSDYYFDITVDGVRITRYANITAAYETGYGVYGEEDLSFGSIISPAAEPLPLGSNYFEIVKGVLPGGNTASNETFKNFLNPGSYPYAAVDADQGINIVYTDINGKTWQSNAAPATQTDGSFTITSSVEGTDGAGDFIVKVKATFNCRLYDDSGNFITITNGKYSGIFQKF
jgi:hypothetical protein